MGMIRHIGKFHDTISDLFEQNYAYFYSYANTEPIDVHTFRTHSIWYPLNRWMHRTSWLPLFFQWCLKYILQHRNVMMSWYHTAGTDYPFNSCWFFYISLSWQIVLNTAIPTSFSCYDNKPEIQIITVAEQNTMPQLLNSSTVDPKSKKESPCKLGVVV